VRKKQSYQVGHLDECLIKTDRRKVFSCDSYRNFVSLYVRLHPREREQRRPPSFFFLSQLSPPSSSSFLSPFIFLLTDRSVSHQQRRYTSNSSSLRCLPCCRKCDCNGRTPVIFVMPFQALLYSQTQCYSVSMI